MASRDHSGKGHLNMGPGISQSHLNQRRRPRKVAASSPKGTDPVEDPFADRSIQSSQPATEPSASSTSRAPPRPTSLLSASAAPVRKSLLPNRPKYFQSRRIQKDQIVRPWVDGPRDTAEKWIELIPLIGLFVGVLVATILIWDGIRSVVNHEYCTVLHEDWSQGFRPNIWQPEIQVGGFGNGEFEESTDAPQNLYVEHGHLFLRATLQDEHLINEDNVMDLGDRCTADSGHHCVAITNTAAGNSSIVPPVLSARINTKNSAKIKYGRVEVLAKMPKGDWLWPAIWMMPVNNTYGPWPASGEIDIAESRGNNHTYWEGGDNVVSSALHWGPDSDNDMWWQTYKKRTARHSVYSEGFNLFAVEWSQKYLFTYLNSRLMQVMYTPFGKKMWKRGNFPNANSNGTRLLDPWSHTGRDNSPFDQEFYLILNLAVGGTNGWFRDGMNGKPWLDTSKNAPKEFWEARHMWYPSWTQPYMEVKKVSILQQCDGNEHQSH